MGQSDIFLESMQRYHQHRQEIQQLKIKASNGDNQALVRYLKELDLLDIDKQDLDYIIKTYQPK